MGAEAGEAYIVLGVSPAVGEERALELVRGAVSSPRATGTAIAGGDVVARRSLTVSRDGRRLGGREQELRLRRGATGRSGRRDRRSGGRGGSAVRGPRRRRRRAAARSDAAAAEGARCGAGAHAMIDLSDGLATDAGHIGARSGVCLRDRAGALPLEDGVARSPSWPSRGAAARGRRLRAVLLRARRARAAWRTRCATRGGAQVTWIGRVVRGPAGRVALGRARRGAPAGGLRAPLVSEAALRRAGGICSCVGSSTAVPACARCGPRPFDRLGHGSRAARGRRRPARCCVRRANTSSRLAALNSGVHADSTSRCSRPRDRGAHVGRARPRAGRSPCR